MVKSYRRVPDCGAQWSADAGSRCSRPCPAETLTLTWTALFAVQALSSHLQPADRLIASRGRRPQAPLVRLAPWRGAGETATGGQSMPIPPGGVVSRPAGTAFWSCISHGCGMIRKASRVGEPFWPAMLHVLLHHPGSDLAQRPCSPGTPTTESRQKLRCGPFDVSSLIDGAAPASSGWRPAAAPDFRG